MKKKDIAKKLALVFVATIFIFGGCSESGKDSQGEIAGSMEEKSENEQEVESEEIVKVAQKSKKLITIKKGDFYRSPSGKGILIVSSEELEFKGFPEAPSEIILGKYSIEGNKMRVVFNLKGSTLVEYYMITSDGLRDKKGEYFLSPEAWEEQKILISAAKGDLYELESLLEKGANVNFKDDYGTTPLTAAVLGGKVDAVNFLLTRGANVNVKNKFGTTALIMATVADNKEIVKLIKNAGAKWPKDDVGEPSSEFYCGCVKHSLNLLPSLISQYYNQHKTFPSTHELRTVISRGKFPPMAGIKIIIKKADEDNLIASGSHPRCPNIYSWDSSKGGLQSEHEARLAGEKARLEREKVEKEARLAREKAEANSTLLKAVKENNISLVKSALAKGADVEMTNEYGATPLIIASGLKSEETHRKFLAQDVEIVKILIDHGANINSEGNSSFPPLIVAISYDRDEITNLLLAKGADVNVNTGVLGSTPLMKASSFGNSEVVKSLLKLGATVNAKDFHGNTALMYTTGRINGEVIKALLEAGADVNVVNKEGMTALELIKRKWGKKAEPTIQLLRNYGAKK